MTDSCAVLLYRYCNLQLCKCCLCTAWSCNEVCGHPHHHWCPEHMCLHGEALHGKTPASLTLTSRMEGPRASHGSCDLWLSLRAVVARSQCVPATLYGPRGVRALLPWPNALEPFGTHIRLRGKMRVGRSTLEAGNVPGRLTEAMGLPQRRLLGRLRDIIRLVPCGLGACGVTFPGSRCKSFVWPVLCWEGVPALRRLTSQALPKRPHPRGPERVAGAQCARATTALRDSHRSQRP